MNVAIDGNVIAVGVPAAGDDEAGRVYVYNRDDNGTPALLDDDQWIRRQHLTSPRSNSFRFGSATTIEGDTLVVAASGNVFVFTQNGFTWESQASLVSVPGGPESVALHGSTLAAGAGNSVNVWTGSGSSWRWQARIIPPDAGVGTFGASLALGPDTLVIGWPDANSPKAQRSGAVYLYARQGEFWRRVTKLTAFDAETEDAFGASVALSGDTIVVGAPMEEDLCAFYPCNSGSVYVFTRLGGTWSLQAKLTAADFGSGDQFGKSVALDGDRLVVGALDGDDTCDVDPCCTESNPGGFCCCDSGSAYVFQRFGTTWVQQQKLLARSVGQNDQFGNAVGISNGHIVVGAFNDSDFGEIAGSAYVFEGITDCNENGLRDSDELAAGVVPDCNQNEVPDECDLNHGSSNDCDTNAVPDECDPDCNVSGLPDLCDMTNGTSADCNDNQLPDECEVATGDSRDCNGNGRPDECDTLHVAYESGDMAPLGDGFPHTFHIPNPPRAGGNVRFSFVARGDLGSVAEAVHVELNGTRVGTVFAQPGRDCGSPVDKDSFVITGRRFNVAVESGEAVVGVVTSEAVDPSPQQCDSFIRVRVEYQGAERDCNGNFIPDECEFGVYGDFDHDRQVGPFDHSVFASCVSGSCLSIPCVIPVNLSTCCRYADEDRDGDIDLRDVAAFMRSFGDP